MRSPPLLAQRSLMVLCQPLCQPQGHIQQSIQCTQGREHESHPGWQHGMWHVSIVKDAEAFQARLVKEHPITQPYTQVASSGRCPLALVQSSLPSLVYLSMLTHRAHRVMAVVCMIICSWHRPYLTRPPFPSLPCHDLCPACHVRTPERPSFGALLRDTLC